jgi:protein TonB
MPRQPPGHAVSVWRVARVPLLFAGACAVGLLLFLLLWWHQRSSDFYRPGTAPQNAEGQVFEPLPAPLPAGEAGNNASGMGEPDQAIANAPPPPHPAAAAPLPRPSEPAAAPAIAAAATAPVPISSPPPQYPREALRSGESGTVLLRVRVAPDGSPVDVELVESSHSRILDRAATEAVRRWRFRPALRDGQPVEGVVQVPIAFTPG